MIKPVSLGDIAKKLSLDPTKARKRTLDAVKQYNEAQAKLEAYCKEKGIEIPELTCKQK